MKLNTTPNMKRITSSGKYENVDNRIKKGTLIQQKDATQVKDCTEDKSRNSQLHSHNGLHKMVNHVCGILGWVVLIICGILCLLLILRHNDNGSTQSLYITLGVFALIWISVMFSRHVRCVVFLIVPSMFTGKGRAMFMLIILVTLQSNSILNITHNAQQASASMDCAQELVLNQTLMLKSRVREPIRKLKQEIYEGLQGLKTVSDGLIMKNQPVIHTFTMHGLKYGLNMATRVLQHTSEGSGGEIHSVKTSCRKDKAECTHEKMYPADSQDINTLSNDVARMGMKVTNMVEDGLQTLFGEKNQRKDFIPRAINNVIDLATESISTFGKLGANLMKSEKLEETENGGLKSSIKRDGGITDKAFKLVSNTIKGDDGREQHTQPKVNIAGDGMKLKLPKINDVIGLAMESANTFGKLGANLIKSEFLENSKDDGPLLSIKRVGSITNKVFKLVSNTIKGDDTGKQHIEPNVFESRKGIDLDLPTFIADSATRASKNIKHKLPENAVGNEDIKPKLPDVLSNTHNIITQGSEYIKHKLPNILSDPTMDKSEDMKHKEKSTYHFFSNKLEEKFGNQDKTNSESKINGETKTYIKSKTSWITSLARYTIKAYPRLVLKIVGVFSKSNARWIVAVEFIFNNILVLTLIFLCIKSIIYLQKFLSVDSFDNFETKKYDQECEDNEKNSVLLQPKVEVINYIDTKLMNPLSGKEKTLSRCSILIFTLYLLMAFIVVFMDHFLYYALTLADPNENLEIYIPLIGSIIWEKSAESNGFIFKILEFFLTVIQSWDRFGMNFNKQEIISKCMPRPIEPDNINIYKFCILLFFGFIFFIDSLHVYGLHIRRKIAAFFFPKREAERIKYIQDKKSSIELVSNGNCMRCEPKTGNFTLICPSPAKL